MFPGKLHYCKGNGFYVEVRFCGFLRIFPFTIKRDIYIICAFHTNQPKLRLMNHVIFIFFFPDSLKMSSWKKQIGKVQIKSLFPLLRKCLDLNTAVHFEHSSTLWPVSSQWIIFSWCFRSLETKIDSKIRQICPKIQIMLKLNH